MDRLQRSTATYEQLFGPLPASDGDDPELRKILRGFIFGDVFHTGTLDVRRRELITCVVLATQQCLPQLRSHTRGALTAGASPEEVREAVYLVAPFIGFPKTLNAVAAMNEGFSDAGVRLPLPDVATVSEADRYSAGLAIQEPLYGDEIADAFAWLPDGLGADLARMLAEHGFGDFYTRGVLSLADRELLVLCLLAAQGDTTAQLAPHARANLDVGNDAATIVTALIHCFGYIGFPRVSNALRAIRGVLTERP